MRPYSIAVAAAADAGQPAELGGAGVRGRARRFAEFSRSQREGPAIVVEAVEEGAYPADADGFEVEVVGVEGGANASSQR